MRCAKVTPRKELSDHIPVKLKYKKRIAVISGVLLIIAAISIFYFNFTKTGYLFTIHTHGFTEAQDGIYVDNLYSGDISGILSLAEEARERVSDFWKGSLSNPIIVVSENERKLERMGWTGSPALATTVVLNGANTFIVVSPEGLEADILAHELCHAELHYRVFDGKLFSNLEIIPTWFDEGVALQVDYRDRYNENAWIAATDNGRNVTDFNQLATPNGFYHSEIEVRRYNNIISKHEVSGWIEENGIEALYWLVEQINEGKQFDTIY